MYAIRSYYELELQAHGKANQVAALATQNLPSGLELGGNIDLHGHLEGPADQVAFALRFDLAQFQGRYGEAINLPATAEAAWTARGVLYPNLLQITDSDLTLPPLHGTFHGEVGWGAEPTVNLTGEVALDDFADLYHQVPALATAGLHGGMTAAVDMTGPLAKPDYRGSVTLNGLGLSMHGIIADISAVRGQRNNFV